MEHKKTIEDIVGELAHRISQETNYKVLLRIQKRISWLSDFIGKRMEKNKDIASKETII